MKLNKMILLPLSIMCLSGCNGNNKTTIYAYSACYDYEALFIERMVEEKFPQYDLQFQLLSTGGMTDRLLNEGQNTVADIFIGLDITNTEMINEENNNVFYDLSDYDTSHYLDDARGHESRHHKYHIQQRESTCMLINNKVLRDNNLTKPTSYEDLLKPGFKDLVMAGNPTTSGSGYELYKNLIETWGLNETLDYYGKLSHNVKEFSTSGSAPIKSCDRGEIAVGFGGTMVASKYMKENKDLEIVFLKEGLPYNFYTMGIINGKEAKPGVKDVYDYLFNEVNYKYNAVINPHDLFKPEYTLPCELENFPTNLVYGEMGDIYNFNYKQSLLDKWEW